MVTRSPGALPTIGKRTGERPDQKAASPSHSQERPSLVVSDCISAPSGETSTTICRLAMRTVPGMEFPLLGHQSGTAGRHDDAAGCLLFCGNRHARRKQQEAAMSNVVKFKRPKPPPEPKQPRPGRNKALAWIGVAVLLVLAWVYFQYIGG